MLKTLNNLLTAWNFRPIYTLVAVLLPIGFMLTIDGAGDIVPAIFETGDSHMFWYGFYKSAFGLTVLFGSLYVASLSVALETAQAAMKAFVETMDKHEPAQWLHAGLWEAPPQPAPSKHSEVEFKIWTQSMDMSV